MQNTPLYEISMQGYRMILPNTMTTMGHCRIVALVREQLEVEVINDLMEKDLATIWMKIRRRGKK